MNEEKGISFKEAHPDATDPYIIGLVIGLILVGSLLIYFGFVLLPLNEQQTKAIKNMDCEELKTHLLKHDLIITEQTLQSEIIGRCLK